MKDLVRSEGSSGYSRFWRALVVGAAGLLALGLTACGADQTADEDFPSEQIELIVPWAPGGGTDQTSRQLASAAEESCETGIIVSNQEGGGGAVGHQAIADAQPDGYTVGVATVEISILNHLGAAQTTPEDMQGVMQFQASPATLSVPADSPYETLDDLTEAMESDEQIRVGTNGRGAIWDMSAGGFAQEVGADFAEYVPFDGGAPTIAAALGGDIEVVSASSPEIVGQVESGDLRPLVVMSEDSQEVLPDTPTTVEEGIDWTRGNWFGLVVPNETPEENIQALNDCFEEAYNSESFTDFMETQGYGLEYKPADEFEAYMDEEFDTYADLVDQLYN